MQKTKTNLRNNQICLEIVPGSTLAHLTTRIICLPASWLRLVSRWSVVSGCVLSYPANTTSGSMSSRTLHTDGDRNGATVGTWGTRAVDELNSFSEVRNGGPSFEFCREESSLTLFIFPNFLDFRAEK